LELSKEVDMAALFPTDPLSLGNAQRVIQARNVLTQCVNLLNNWMAWIYANPNPSPSNPSVTATPQDVVANLGTAAAGLFESASALAAVIGAATGTTPQVPPTGWTATPNSDGTVTLTQS
jgi:hypothetical protein